MYIHGDRNEEAYNEVQFSVHIEGLLGVFGPPKVCPHFIPLQVLICIESKPTKKKNSQLMLLQLID